MAEINTQEASGTISSTGTESRISQMGMCTAVSIRMESPKVKELIFGPTGPNIEVSELSNVGSFRNGVRHG